MYVIAGSSLYFKNAFNNNTSRITNDTGNAANASGLRFQTGNNTTALTIDASQNATFAGSLFGFGITSPTQAYGIDKTLHIHSSATSGNRGAGLHLTTNSSGTASGDGARIAQVDNDLMIYNHESGLLNLGTNGGSALIIDSSKRVLIGLNASAANASIDDLQVGNPNSSTQTGITIGSNDEGAIAFGNNGDARAGSITYNMGSDAMIFKTNGQNTALTINNSQNATFAGTLTAGGADFAGLLTEAVTITAGKLSDNTNLNLSGGNVFHFTTTESTTSTPNLRYDGSTTLNSKMSTGDTVSVTIITSAAAAGYSAQLTIDGAAVTEKWAGGAAPAAGSAAGYDVYAYTIIKTGSAAWTVLATFSNFA